MHFKHYLIIYSRINLLSINKEDKPVKLYPEILEMRPLARYFSLPNGSELEIDSFTYDSYSVLLLLL